MAGEVSCSMSTSVAVAGPALLLEGDVGEEGEEEEDGGGGTILAWLGE